MLISLLAAAVVAASTSAASAGTFLFTSVRSVAVSVSGGRYHRLADARSLRKLAKRLHSGRYVFRFKARDRNGNRTKRPQPVTVILR